MSEEFPVTEEMIEAGLRAVGARPESDRLGETAWAAWLKLSYRAMRALEPEPSVVVEREA